MTDLYLPGGNGVRIDSAVYNGYEVTPYYDSMLAKLIVHGENREEAIKKMISALGEVIVEGIDTTWTTCIAFSMIQFSKADTLM